VIDNPGSPEMSHKTLRRNRCRSGEKKGDQKEVSAHWGSAWRVIIARGATGIVLDTGRRSVTSVARSRVDTSQGRLYAHGSFI
jgi:hypothetical protein